MRIGPKEKSILKLLREGPKSASEIYYYLGALDEGKKRSIRESLKRLREKGLIYKIPNSPLYALTKKGEALSEVLEEE